VSEASFDKLVEEAQRDAPGNDPQAVFSYFQMLLMRRGDAIREEANEAVGVTDDVFQACLIKFGNVRMLAVRPADHRLSCCVLVCALAAGRSCIGNAGCAAFLPQSSLARVAPLTRPARAHGASQSDSRIMEAVVSMQQRQQQRMMELLSGAAGGQ
jgi:hypothetical protein